MNQSLSINIDNRNTMKPTPFSSPISFDCYRLISIIGLSIDYLWIKICFPTNMRRGEKKGLSLSSLRLHFSFLPYTTYSVYLLKRRLGTALKVLFATTIYCTQLQRRSLYLGRAKTMYLLTEWEGRTGKYLAWGQGVRTERSEVHTSWPRAK